MQIVVGALLKSGRYLVSGGENLLVTKRQYKGKQIATVTCDTFFTNYYRLSKQCFEW